MMAKRSYTALLKLFVLPEIHTIIRFYSDLEKKPISVISEEYFLGLRSMKKDWESFYPSLDMQEFIKENYAESP